MSKHDIISIGHSPDPDDAFMVWALAEGIVHADDFGTRLVAQDIETLNRWALSAASEASEDERERPRRLEPPRPRALDVSALSAATFARVADKYWLLRHGSSFGDGYGPVVVAREPMTLDALRSATVLSPGENTTAHATLQLAAPGVKATTKPFDRIMHAVKRGDADAGVLIHEGQLTWQDSGLHKVVDLGAWWKQETGLPLPLGVNTMRKDLGAGLGADVNALLKASLETGLVMRTRALAYARGFGRGISEQDADEFVSMYVNEMTRDMGELGERAIQEFVKRTGGRARIEFAPDD